MWHVASGSCKSIKENMTVVIVTVFCYLRDKIIDFKQHNFFLIWSMLEY